MPILNEDLLGKIDEAKGKIDERKLDLFVDSLFQNLVEESIVNASIQDADNASRKDEVVKNFRKAWKWGWEHYHGQFALDLLTDIAGRVEPGQKALGREYADYRQTSASLKGWDYSPPADGARIQEHLDRLLSTLKTESLHPVEEAIFLYFHLTRIQSFDNGNKRTASIVMNLTLFYNGFPPAFINPREKNVYSALLKPALTEFMELGAEGDVLKGFTSPGYRMRGFYELFGNKVLAHLQSAEDHLKYLPRYTVEFQTSDPGTMYTAKSKLRGWFDARKAPHLQTLKAHERTLEVVGQIPYEVIDSLLSPIRRLKYSITTRTN